eukprot:5758434-Prymnesium_polylepis.3
MAAPSAVTEGAGRAASVLSPIAPRSKLTCRSSPASQTAAADEMCTRKAGRLPPGVKRSDDSSEEDATVPARRQRKRPLSRRVRSEQLTASHPIGVASAESAVRPAVKAMLKLPNASVGTFFVYGRGGPPPK